MEDYDPSINILYRYPQPLDSIFLPKNVAVIGATEKEGSVGRTLLWNLLRSPFGGTVYPVNPKRKSVLGIKAYPNLTAICEKIDLAVIVIPAAEVPHVIDECIKTGVKSAIIISSGFRETGPAGAQLEKSIREKLKNSNLRIIGPNCLGIMNTSSGLNATFASDIAIKGNTAFISQSGALCTAVLDWSLKEKVGFSAFVSIGSMLDVGWGDLINYFGSDPNTETILIYMESIGNTRAFISAAREVALNKPIILIKAGRTAESAQAASSHTGALVGSDEVLNVALKRAGVLRVDDISELFSMAEIFSKQPRPKAPFLSIVTNAGGPGVIATDALIRTGARLSFLNKATKEKLSNFLPSAWSHNNPIDILGDADPVRYEKTIETILSDPEAHGILVILTPQYMTDPFKTAEILARFGKNGVKPIFASWMGGESMVKAKAVLADSDIPCFDYPDAACKAFSYMCSYSEHLKELYETPFAESDLFKNSLKQGNEKVSIIFENARKEKRVLLNEFETKEILQNYGIDVVKTFFAATKEEAIKAALDIGFPVVVKLCSNIITHKTDVGGVKLNLLSEAEVESAFDELCHINGFQGVTVQEMVTGRGIELILGSSVDHEFGPVLLFGSGGEFVEVYQDYILALPPLNSSLASKMIERTKINKALHGFRKRKAIDFSKLEQTMVRFSNLIMENPIIKECDINPLFVSDLRIVGLDARIVLHEAGEAITVPAICPYPLQYVKTVKSKSGQLLRAYPIRPEDEPLVMNFYRELSENSLRQRYLKSMHYQHFATHEQLIRTCFIDYDRDLTMVISDGLEIIALGKLSKIVNTHDARFSLIVKDKWQGRGIGFLLLSMLLDIAKEEKIKKVMACMFADNEVMKKLCLKTGFAINSDAESGFLIASKDV